MKNRRCINWVLSCFTVIPIACNTLTAFHVSAEAAEKVMDVPYQLYQSAEQYDCNSNLKVNSMLYGRATMGDFKVHGDISDVIFGVFEVACFGHYDIESVVNACCVYFDA